MKNTTPVKLRKTHSMKVKEVRKQIKDLLNRNISTYVEETVDSVKLIIGTKHEYQGGYRFVEERNLPFPINNSLKKKLSCMISAKITDRLRINDYDQNVVQIKSKFQEGFANVWCLAIESILETRYQENTIMISLIFPDWTIGLTHTNLITSSVSYSQIAHFFFPLPYSDYSSEIFESPKVIILPLMALHQPTFIKFCGTKVKISEKNINSIFYLAQNSLSKVNNSKLETIVINLFSVLFRDFLLTPCEEHVNFFNTLAALIKLFIGFKFEIALNLISTVEMTTALANFYKSLSTSMEFDMKSYNVSIYLRQMESDYSKVKKLVKFSWSEGTSRRLALLSCLNKKKKLMKHLRKRIVLGLGANNLIL